MTDLPGARMHGVVVCIRPVFRGRIAGFQALLCRMLTLIPLPEHHQTWNLESSSHQPRRTGNPAVELIMFCTAAQFRGLI